VSRGPIVRAGWPLAADFALPPTPADHARWLDADAAARPRRVARLRTRLEAAGLDAYAGLRREHMRYLTGFTLADGEEKVAGTSGQFLVSGEEIVVLADSRYAIQARREALGARIVDGPRDLAHDWAALVASVGARRIGVEAALLPHAVWRRLEAAAPDVELVPV
jgi:Xaa-Pro aminopeptidase